jgi:hypothetical protein
VVETATSNYVNIAAIIRPTVEVNTLRGIKFYRFAHSSIACISIMPLVTNSRRGQIQI